MTVSLSEDEKRKRLSTLLDLFDTAMLVTHTAEGGMRARPLSIAESQDDGAMYFSTAVDSPKVEELEAGHPQLLCFWRQIRTSTW